MGESSGASRRGFLAGLVGGALVIGFDPARRRWVRADAAGCGAFPLVGVPPLDGTLHLDPATRMSDQTDQGNLVTTLPAAVLRPGSIEDIRKMVAFCRAHGIQVAARGQHHTMHGQGLTCGLIVEMSTLAQIHSISADGAVVDAGVTWHDLYRAAFAHGLRPVTTGFTKLSVGGTLSVGGCPLSNHQGALVDHARELTMVTGTGQIVPCSATRHRDLFEAALGGLGQCGIIARAKVDLLPAKPKARTYLLHYTDTATFFRDFRTLVARGELDEVYNVCQPPSSSLFVYQINATIFFDDAAPPDDAFLMRGLALPAVSIPHLDQPFLDYAFFVDDQIALLQLAGFDRLQKPWFDVWLNDRSVEPYVGDIVRQLTPSDVGTAGFILLFAQRRSKMSRPFFRMPEPDGSDWVYLFDVCTQSALPLPDPTFVQAMLARNRRWFDRARALGGTRYPIGALEFNAADWRAHYGTTWNAFAAAKHRWDPATILTPGPGIF